MMKVALSLLFLPLTAASTAFYINNDFSCDRDLTISDVTVECGDGSNLCELGDNLDAQGYMSFGQEMPSDARILFKACFMGMNFDMFCREYEEDGVDLCNELSLTSLDGQSCPSTGDYTFDVDIKLPGESTNLMSGWWVTITTVIYDNDGVYDETTCTNSISAKSSSQMAWSGALLGAAVLCLGAAGYVRRKRRVGKIDLVAEEDRAVTGDFEMMTDRGVTV